MNRKWLLLCSLLVLTLVFSSLASASTLAMFTATVSTSDPTQQGRLSRNGVPQDWFGDEAFPGTINTGVTYHYHVYDIPGSVFDVYPGFSNGYAGFVNVDVDSLSGNTFVAGYLDSYDPTNKGATWLGDPGTSGNYFGTDPLAFQVFVPQGHDLLLVVNNTGGSNLGTGDQLKITVEGFIDTLYTDPSPTPEPASLMLLGSGLLAAFATMRKRIRS